MKMYLLAVILTLFFFSCSKEKGCIDFTASNYNESAEENDGSCIYVKNEPPVEPLACAPCIDTNVTILKRWVMSETTKSKTYFSDSILGWYSDTGYWWYSNSNHIIEVLPRMENNVKVYDTNEVRIHELTCNKLWLIYQGFEGEVGHSYCESN